MYSLVILLSIFLQCYASPIFETESVGKSVIESSSGIIDHEKAFENFEEGFGWISVGDPMRYLKFKKSLKNPIQVSKLDDYQVNLTQEQNMARWALSQVEEKRVESLVLKRRGSEVFTALIWLIGIAEGKSEEWSSRIKGWNDYKGELPPGRARVARYHENFEQDYHWLERSRMKNLARSEDSDETAISIYLGSVLFSKIKGMPDKGLYYKLELIERSNHDQKPFKNVDQEFGWVSVGDPMKYLRFQKWLKTPIEVSELDDYLPNLTQEQNMARWALHQATEDRVEFLVSRHRGNEVFTALVWLIGIAEGKYEEWISKIKSWNEYKGKLPYGRARVSRFRQDFQERYKWIENSRSKGLARSEDSDVMAMAIYLGFDLFSRGKSLPNQTFYYKSGLKTKVKKPKGSILLSFKKLCSKLPKS
ncbi:hypothetical protein DFH28DRAFT_965768 [Melampsora americana]|nr:hypothetical protein DFH28DRAFT_965768 [Melampsora americana]